MDLAPLLDIAAKAIYAALGLVALYGIFTVILILRRIAQKRFSSNAAAEQFLDDARGRLQRQDFDGVAELCDSPPHWAKAVPQLILVAVGQRHRGPEKLRRLLAERFEREVLSDLEYRTSWIATIAKSAPMLGLLGTVIGMINAFAEISAMQQTGTDPSKLAGDISFALFTTALGLIVAIPMVLAGAAIQVRIGKLQDSVQQHLGEFLEDLDAVAAEPGRQTS